jgi:hypothetical protein
MYIDAEIKGFNSPEVRAAVVHAHRRVMDAIRDGDGEAAARRMSRHVDAYTESMRAATATPRVRKPAVRRLPAAARQEVSSLPLAKVARR